MPYRRLPNTDAARIRALQKAVEKAVSLPLQECAISYELLLKAKFFLPSLQGGIKQSRSSRSKSIEKSATFYSMQKKTKMYISHFIQVMNMAIARGEMKVSDRGYYGLKDFGRKLPSLETAEDVVEWGKKIIDGETIRIANGGTYMSNPRITMVKIMYDKFLDQYRLNEFRLTNDKRTSEFVIDLRHRADAVILEIWDMVEEYFSKLDAEEKRQKAIEYGLVYVFRKTELANKTE